MLDIVTMEISCQLPGAERHKVYQDPVVRQGHRLAVALDPGSHTAAALCIPAAFCSPVCSYEIITIQIVMSKEKAFIVCYTGLLKLEWVTIWTEARR